MTSTPNSQTSNGWVTIMALSSITAFAYYYAMTHSTVMDRKRGRRWTCWWENNNNNNNDGDDRDRSILLPSAHEHLILCGTPMIHLQRVSYLIRRNIYVKMENLNPGGTGKDRAALSMIQRAETEGYLPHPISLPRIGGGDQRHGEGTTESLNPHPHPPPPYDLLLQPTTTTMTNPLEQMIRNMISQAMMKSRTGGLVVEGTSGSTGIALATLCAGRGHGCLVVLPDDQAQEKQTILKSLGAVVYEVPTASISNPQHYVNLARRVAKVARDEFHIQAIFTDQFENDANYDIHYSHTGPEIWNQTKRKKGGLDAFVMSSGTGGTIAGVGTYLKEQQPSIQIVLVDPPGSVLYNKIEHGIAYTTEQRERTLKKHRYDTIAEGIGLDRITKNFTKGMENIDRSYRVTDQEAVDMAHWILQTEGLWIGSSSAMNVVGAIRTALELDEQSNIVTMICDGGQRHITRFWNPSFIEGWGLQWPSSNCIPDCLRSVLKGEDLPHDKK